MFKYVIAENRWYEIHLKSGFRPATLSNHNTFAYGRTALIVIGGDPVNTRVFLLKNFGEGWLLADVIGICPLNLKQRCGRVGKRIVMFGDDRIDTNAYMLDIKRWHWLPVYADGVKPLPEVRNYTVCEGENCLWFHGGVSKFKNMEQTLYRVTIREPEGTKTDIMPRDDIEEDRYIRSLLENPNRIREEKWSV